MPIPSESPRSRNSGWLASAPFVAVGAAIVGLALLLLIPTPPPSGRSPCASNLRQIGQAAQLYALDHGGYFPDDIEGLLTQDIIPSVFVCPNSGDTPAAPGPTTQATATDVRASGHCSYVYLGKGWKAKEATFEMVLAYEPLENHERRGMNVVFGDGHVDWVEATEARGMLAELGSGHNPPRREMINPGTRTGPATSRPR